MESSRQPRRPTSFDLLLFVVGVAAPIGLLVIGAHMGILLVTALMTAAVWMVVWSDPGFLPGCFLFWIALIVATQATIEPGQIDNILPGLAVPFGWVPFVVVVGPIFLLLKSFRRLKSEIRQSSLSTRLN